MCEKHSETLFVEEVKEMKSGSGRLESARTARDGSGWDRDARDGPRTVGRGVIHWDHRDPPGSGFVI